MIQQTGFALWLIAPPINNIIEGQRALAQFYLYQHATTVVDTALPELHWQAILASSFRFQSPNPLHIAIDLSELENGAEAYS